MWFQLLPQMWFRSPPQMSTVCCLFPLPRHHCQTAEPPYVIVFMGAPIHWVSKKHQHVGESSAEDEYMALNHTGKMVVWLRNLFKEMGLGEIVSTPTLMLGDNKQACQWSRIEMVTNSNRFIERQYHKVREFILAGDLETRYINTKLNVSDVFTEVNWRHC